MLEPVAAAVAVSEWSFGDEAVTEDLPVRTPGRTFDDHDPSPTVGVGNAAIKSSLVDYERGRQAAAEERGDTEMAAGDHHE